MERRYHSTAHFKTGITLDYATGSIRTTVTLMDLKSLAMLVTAKYNLAVFHKCDVQIHELEKQLIAVTEEIIKVGES